MNKNDFEQLLEELCIRLSNEVKLDDAYHKPSLFEKRVRIVMAEMLAGTGSEAAPGID